MIYLNIVGRGSNWFIKINGCKNGWNVRSLSIIKDEFYDIELWGFLSMLVKWSHQSLFGIMHCH